MRNSQPYKSPLAAMFWSLVLPGFGQLYNRNYYIGTILLILEFLINLKSHLNIVLLDTLTGDIQRAHDSVNYSWGLFYPSIYGFALWQAFNMAISNNNRLEGTGVEKRTYLSGLFIGLVIGMDFGLFWHDTDIIQRFSFLDYPVFNGLFFGLLFGLLAHLAEIKIYRRKLKRLLFKDYI